MNTTPTTAAKALSDWFRTDVAHLPADNGFRRSQEQYADSLLTTYCPPIHPVTWDVRGESFIATAPISAWGFLKMGNDYWRVMEVVDDCLTVDDLQGGSFLATYTIR